MSQLDLALKSGISRNTITGLGTSVTKIRIITLFILVQALEIPTDLFIKEVLRTLKEKFRNINLLYLLFQFSN